MRFPRLVALAVLAAVVAQTCTALPRPATPIAEVAPTPTPTPSLTPAATIELVDANHAVLAEAEAYPEDYCGRYLNNGTRADLPGGAFVSLWRANLGAHAAAIRSRADGRDPLAFLGCTFAYRDLDRLTNVQLSGDALAWLATIPAASVSTWVDEINNRVEMDISSAVPGAAELTLAHYTNAFRLPAGILYVTSDGNGAALRPWGTIRLTVLGPDGRPVHVRNDLYIEWAPAGDLPNLYCGNWDQGVGVSEDGSPTEFPCQAGHWRISVLAHAEPGAPVVGSGVVTVVGGKTVDLRIKVSAVPTPAP